VLELNNYIGTTPVNELQPSNILLISIVSIFLNNFFIFTVVKFEHLANIPFASVIYGDNTNESGIVFNDVQPANMLGYEYPANTTASLIDERFVQPSKYPGIA
jgi:hypothetical protein